MKTPTTKKKNREEVEQRSAPDEQSFLGEIERRILRIKEKRTRKP